MVARESPVDPAARRVGGTRTDAPHLLDSSLRAARRQGKDAARPWLASRVGSGLGWVTWGRGMKPLVGTCGCTSCGCCHPTEPPSCHGARGAAPGLCPLPGTSLLGREQPVEGSKGQIQTFLCPPAALPHPQAAKEAPAEHMERGWPWPRSRTATRATIAAVAAQPSRARMERAAGLQPSPPSRSRSGVPWAPHWAEGGAWG